jgi:pyroglutamyl-peptidase
MKILITGFKPFNNETINPSLLLLSQLDKNYKNHEIHTQELDVLYNKDSQRLIEKIKEINPDLILMLGQAGGRPWVSFEFCAINIKNASIPDNNGKVLIHETIKERGPLAYQTNINIDKILYLDEKLKVSYNCGTFICNEIYYNSLDYIYNNKLNTKCAFIHIPYIYEQTLDKKPNTPYMELIDIKNILYKLIDKIK